MKGIQVSAQLRIHDGKFDEFKVVAAQCIQTVKEKDKGTLQYDWFLNADQTFSHVREKYIDSNAVLEHMANLGDTLGNLLSLCDLSLEIYGSPSDKLTEALQGINVAYYPPLEV